MGEQEHRGLQEAPGTEEQTGNPDAEVGEQGVPDDQPGAGRTEEQSSGSRHS